MEKIIVIVGEHYRVIDYEHVPPDNAEQRTRHSKFSHIYTRVYTLLGCTARRAALGIHRTQAGRRGSSIGCGQRAGARCTTTTPSIDSATSATVPGRPVAGWCRPCARPGAGPIKGCQSDMSSFNTSQLHRKTQVLPHRHHTLCRWRAALV
jgi:hypothetical protein